MKWLFDTHTWTINTHIHICKDIHFYNMLLSAQFRAACVLSEYFQRIKAETIPRTGEKAPFLSSSGWWRLDTCHIISAAAPIKCKSNASTDSWLRSHKWFVMCVEFNLHLTDSPKVNRLILFLFFFPLLVTVIIMSQRKNRIALSAVSTAKVKRISKSKSNVASSQLTGIDEIPQSDIGNTPFILVDGMSPRSRHELHLALTKCEERRMKRIQTECSVLPLLEYTKPPTSDEPTTIEEQNAKEEEKFQEDLKQLCIAELDRETTGTVTPIAHATSDEDLLQNKKRLEKIRLQLEELRQKQNEAKLCSPCSEKDSSLVTTKQPGLLRQGTFDVKRSERLANTFSSSSIASYKDKSMGYSLANDMNLSERSVTLRQPQINNEQPRSSTTCTLKNKSFQLFPNSKTTNRALCDNAPKSHELSKMVNKISDLGFQLPHQQQEKQNLDKGSSTYLESNTPTTDTVNSDEETITSSTRHSRMPLPLACSSSRSSIYNGKPLSSPLFNPTSSRGSKTTFQTPIQQL